MTAVILTNDGLVHDDIIKWKHFPRYWPFVRGIHWSPVKSPHKDQWCGALLFSLICAWNKGWVHNGETGDLIQHCALYDATVKFFLTHVCIIQPWCVDSPLPNTTYIHRWYGSLLVQMMACCLFGIRSSTEPVMTSHQSDSEKHFQLKFVQD